MQPRGALWVMLDQSGPISGATYPTTPGIGTFTFNVGWVPGTVGAHIVESTTQVQVTPDKAIACMKWAQG